MIKGAGVTALPAVERIDLNVHARSTQAGTALRPALIAEHKSPLISDGVTGEIRRAVLVCSAGIEAQGVAVDDRAEGAWGPPQIPGNVQG